MLDVQNTKDCNLICNLDSDSYNGNNRQLGMSMGNIYSCWVYQGWVQLFSWETLFVVYRAG